MAPGNRGPDGRGSVLQVDPDAVPMLRNAFVDALAKVDRQLELAYKELRVTSWAQDPVSVGASTAFNERSVDSARSAVAALRAYRTQLDVAVHNLDRTAQQYREMDGEGRSGVNRGGDGG